MASIQKSLADFLTPKLTSLGVARVGLLSIKPPDSGSDKVFCSISVGGAAFEPQDLDSAPVIVTTDLAVDFVFEPRAPNLQDRKDAIFDYLVDEVHGFAGKFSSGDPFMVMSLTLTGYGQSVLEGTDVSVESYGMRAQWHKEARR